MRGHEHVIKARVSGKKPVNGLTFTLQDHPVLPLHTIQIEPSDKPEKADLRFVIGVGVVVWGVDSESTKAWCKAMQKAGAQYAAGNVFDSKDRSVDAFVVLADGSTVECNQ